MKRYAAEFLGTFALVLAGTGAIVVNDLSGGTITHVGIALTFGLVVLAMIYTIGDISGAHINPAPKHMPPEEFRKVRDLIEEKVQELLRKL